MSRVQWTLLGLLAVQGLVLLLSYAPFGDTGAASAPRAFLPAIETLTPSRIEITEPAADDGAQAESLVLAADGDLWTLAERDGYPADPAKVEALLDNLRELRVDRPVLTGSKYHEAMEVDDERHQRRLRLWGDDDADPAVDLILGSSPNYRIRHARLAGEANVYELRGLEYHDLRPDDGAWIDKKLIDVPFDDITSVKVRNRHGSFELTRSEDAWKVLAPQGGPEPDAGEVDAFVRSVASLWVSEPVGPLDAAAQGLLDPEATLELTYQVIARSPDESGAAAAEPGEGSGASVDTEAPGEPGEQAEVAPAPTFATETRTVTVRIGAEAGEDEAGKRYASRAGFDFAVLLGQFDAEKLTAKKLDDLLGADDS